MAITKGELLTALGTNANKFTSFMMNPSLHGITEPYLSLLTIAKQKLDWTATIDLDLPEIQQLIDLLLSLDVINQDDITAIKSVPQATNYNIIIRAQDNITMSNIYGAIKLSETKWLVKVDFINSTTGITISEDFYFDAEPTDMTPIIEETIKRLKTN